MHAGAKRAPVVIQEGPVAAAGIAQDALHVFKGGVRVALERLSRRHVPVMVKTSHGPVIGVPVVKNGVVSVRTNANSGDKSRVTATRR